MIRPQRHLFGGMAYLFATLAAVILSSASARGQALPSPSPAPLAVRGYVRSFDFERQNASNSAQGNAASAPNQHTFSTGIGVHADYHLSLSLSAGATYFYSNPLDGCTSPASHLTPPCGKLKPPSENPDDTIPGFVLSTLDEFYLTYKDPKVYAKVGDQTIVTPWATTADTRLKPAAFQGIDTIY
ncbi:MAG: hypothetical protein M3R51_07555, partial [Candidatus Eremiobacteraeota bacterium]|nr:hypothetical protein [Candidatus Eremiobacteraeota bacterium]